VAGVGANEVSETPACILLATDLWPMVFNAVPWFCLYIAATHATLAIVLNVVQRLKS